MNRKEFTNLLLEWRENFINERGLPHRRIENFTNFTNEDLPFISSKMSSLSEKLELIINNINQGEGTLSKLIADDDLYNNVNNLLVNANNLVTDARSFTDDVQSNPKKYIRAYFAAKREDGKKK